MLNEIYQTETLEQLSAFIQEASSQDRLRQALFAEFDRYAAYANIQEWNRLVRLCEALRITGWGEREPVEAIAEKWINGSYYSGLRTRTFDVVEGSSRGWSKQGNTFVLDDRRDPTDYGIPAIATQRNPLPKNPVRLVGSGNYQQSAQPFVDSLEELRAKLDRDMRQEVYGESFGYLGVCCWFSHHDDPSPSVRYEYFHSEEDVPAGFAGEFYIRPRLEFGKLAKRGGLLKLEVTRHFTRQEGELPLEKQKELFKRELLEIVAVLDGKLRKKKLPYRTDLLREDLTAVLAGW
ncbi:hypothetical protein [Paenibacillus ginsengarvi]|uniref:Uncharacterized protein n=1 Tax=Paenibacillus ginsengarvi TaxID=400777 RepID=A0A3B0CJ26_9BACL|nr:hypothetical protein [Paenibacillus ginsengarvi]RKN84307.1 hypothetical protein D7M11_15025 [Paenibacillus ginsengarvi]